MNQRSHADSVNVVITTPDFLDFSGAEYTIGGAQNYTAMLRDVCRELGWEPIVVQCATQAFDRRMPDGTRIVGVPMDFRGRYNDNRRNLFNAARRILDPRTDLLIFGTERLAVRCPGLRCISIQHGISWDAPPGLVRKHRWYEVYPLPVLRAYLGQWRRIRAFLTCPNRVCVDYNYLNWLRAVREEQISGHNWVVPNFAPKVDAELIRSRRFDEREIRILFARRFVEYRGTKLLAEAAVEILASYPNVRFTLCGDGPDKQMLQSWFAGEDRVTFDRFSYTDTIRVHLEHDIAVVPSLGSEGTSLSLCEGMAAGCAVVATAIGGMANLIFHDYNGLLIQPTASDLIDALKYLIENPQARKRLGEKAYEVSQTAFGLDRWKTAWKNILTEVAGQSISGPKVAVGREVSASSPQYERPASK